MTSVRRLVWLWRLALVLSAMLAGWVGHMLALGEWTLAACWAYPAVGWTYELVKMTQELARLEGES